MCLAVLAINAHPDYPFICLANRDEFHNRPTAPLHAWSTPHGSLWAGKDLQSGGTWLGIGSNAEFALLTNVRNSTLNMPGTAPSRGLLVLDAIQTGTAPDEKASLAFAGFNLIHGNLQRLNLRCTSNQGIKLGNGLDFTTALQTGLYSLSNGHLNAPWPKSRLLKTGLQQEIDVNLSNHEAGAAFENKLLGLLAHTGLAEDAELPSTGVPYEWEKMLSAVKIVSPLYGTRSSAVILLDRYNTVHFTEITFDPAGNEIGRQRIEIPLPPKL
ncbi:NRDE family protein [Limnobacter alexandrii]|jgi:uncharacterized protein with NRDE domain|uniref:NRDE family protein n=1 Tax=Limnobacter alexandrii TaxID=2570352 RepID=UPI001107A85F|nr:NRDE family protein [Limnobacter alexandrii]